MKVLVIISCCWQLKFMTLSLKWVWKTLPDHISFDLIKKSLRWRTLVSTRINPGNLEQSGNFLSQNSQGGSHSWKSKRQYHLLQGISCLWVCTPSWWNEENAFIEWIHDYDEKRSRKLFWKVILYILVSGPASKKLRSHHSVLTTSRSLNKLKNHQLFLY